MYYITVTDIATGTQSAVCSIVFYLTLKNITHFWLISCTYQIKYMQ